MSKKENMKQAMFEMFGVGQDQTEVEETAEEIKKAPANENIENSVVKIAPASAKKPTAASYIAPGTKLEGTLKSEGDVEVAGQFKGNIEAKGMVVLHSNIEGNITAENLRLSGCTLKGDVNAKGTVSINAQSGVTGNITAKEVLCSGTVIGDLVVAENLVLESTACISGNITTGAIAVMKGALIKGGIEIKTGSVAAPAEKK